MKFKLSPTAQKKLDNAVKDNLLHKYLSNKDNMNFEVGDVLIKKTNGYSNKWRYEPVSNSNKMHQRYICVFKDDFGIIYVKQLKVSTGELGEELFCLTDYDYDHIRFEVDPEYAEKVFLDADFDIKSMHASSLAERKLIVKANRKIGVKPKSLKEINKFFGCLKKGDTFWIGKDFTGRNITTYKLLEDPKWLTKSALDQHGYWIWREASNPLNANKYFILDDNGAFKMKLHVVYYWDVNGNGRDNESFCFELAPRQVLFNQAPGKEETK